MKIKYLILLISSKKTDYNKKDNEIEKENYDLHHDKYITTQEFNKLTSENFASRLSQTNLASKNDIAALVKNTDFDDKPTNLKKKVTSNKKNMYLLEMNQMNYQKKLNYYQ